MSDDAIFAIADVARDIIQNSEYFTSAGKAVGEYVWNSIDYCKPNSSVEVHIELKRGKIRVRKQEMVKYNGIVVDERKNGGGMSREDLRRFFTMHGETLARTLGRHVRGRFGTGKAAAFGIARTLMVESIKGGKRNVVRLNQEDLKQGLDKIPISSLLIDQPVDRPDGTVIIIDRLKLKKVKMESVRKFLRRSLGPQLRNHQVFVGEKRLEYTIPPFEREWQFDCPPDRKPLLGDTKLFLRLATKDLEEEEKGVVIMASGYPMEFYELNAGSWKSHIFGETEVSALEMPDPIPAFDNTRSRLNRDNDRVSSLLDWIEQSTSEVVGALETDARARLDKEEMKRLEEVASELANLLNDDFSNVMEELETSPIVAGAGPLESGVQPVAQGAKTYLKDEGGTTRVGKDEHGDIIIQEPLGGRGHGKEPNPDEPTRGKLTENGFNATEARAQGEKKRRRGGFKIDWQHNGKEAFRAVLVPEEMRIILNLDYEELAIFPNHEDPRFKALASEIAIAEYAIATVNIMVERGHVDISNTASDALIEYNRIVNRLGRKVAPLMVAWFGSQAPQGAAA
jgi:hypothetical protein